jgi:cell division protein FtsQ
MWVRIAVFGFWVLLLSVVTVFSSYKNHLRPIENISVSIEAQYPPMISSDSVNKLLTLAQHDSLSPQKRAINLRELEAKLEYNNLIKKAEAFLTIDDILHVNVRPRIPVLRILGDGGYYLDREGSVIPLSPSFEADVPEFCGVINKENHVDAAALAVELGKDVFMRSHLGCMYSQPDGIQIEVPQQSYVLKIRSLDHLKQKFDNYKAFYVYGADNDLLNKYKEVVLDNTNQIIGTKI